MEGCGVFIKVGKQMAAPSAAPPRLIGSQPQLQSQELRVFVEAHAVQAKLGAIEEPGIPRPFLWCFTSHFCVVKPASYEMSLGGSPSVTAQISILKWFDDWMICTIPATS